MSLRAVRSPLAPKMTMEQGSTAFRSASNRQAMSSSRCSVVFTTATLAEAGENFNVHVETFVCATSSPDFSNHQYETNRAKEITLGDETPWPLLEVRGLC